MPNDKLITIDSNALPWEERPNEKIGRSLYRKNLIEDPDTGMEVRLVRYPAGVINVRHTHPCAHGMYVLEGTLVTNSEGGRVGVGGVQYHAAGQSYSDPAGVWHNHSNPGPTPVKYLLLFLSTPGGEITQKAAADD